MENNTAASVAIINQEEMLHHWQGHRGLTRRLIEAFPEDQLFTFSIGGMRPFSAMVFELIDIAGGGVKGIATGQWEKLQPHDGTATMPTTKKEILDSWDEVTRTIETYWPQISEERFRETDSAFGQYKSPVYSSLLYFIDNEIHHRGQGYVYLRALGVEPPPFWER